MQRLFNGILMMIAALCLPGASCIGADVHIEQDSTDQASEDLATLTGDDLVKVDLHADIATFLPGQDLTLAVAYDVRPGWHIYWRNSGDSGMPPELSVKAPAGILVGEVLYPRPEIFQKKQGDSTETTFGYRGKVCLLIPLRITESFALSQIDLSIELEWLVCKSICLLGSKQLKLSIPAALPGRPSVADPFGLRLVNVWRKRLPVPAARARVFASIRDSSLQVTGPAGLSKRVLFIPDHTPGVTSVKRIPVPGVIEDRRFSLDVPLEIRPEDALGEPLRVTGLVLLGSYDRPRAISIDLPLSRIDIPRDDPDSTGVGSSAEH